MKLKDVRVLLIGNGNWGKVHYKTLKALTNNFVVYDIDPGMTKNLDNIADEGFLLSWPDAVIIAASSPVHFELTKRYLFAGKHVLCEKPVVKSRDELDELVEIASNRPDQILMAGHTLIYNSAIRKIKDFIMQGYFREDTSPRIILRRMKHNPIIGDDEIYRLAPHDLSVLDYFGWLHPETLSMSHDETITNKYANIIVSWENKEGIRDLYINNNVNNTMYYEDSKETLMFNNQYVDFDNFPPLMGEQLHFLNLICGKATDHLTGIDHIKRVYGELTRMRKWTPLTK